MFDASWFSSLEHFNEGTEKICADPYDRRKVTILADGWQVAIYRNPSEVPEAVFAGQIPAKLRPVQVPGELQLQDFDMPQYVNTQYPWDGKEALVPPDIPKHDNLIAVYCKSFIAKQIQATHITFDGVESCIALFLNGTFIGYKEDGFTPSVFNLTPLLRKGKNIISCIVAHYTTGSWLGDQDFWRFSGIFRPVYLSFPNQDRINDIFVRPLLSKNLTDGTLDIETEILGNQAKTIEIRLSEVADLSSCISETQLAHTEKTYPTRLGRYTVSEGTNTFPTFHLSNLLAWSSESPMLYGIKLLLIDAQGMTLDTKEEEFGFRRIEIDDGIMKFNGTRLVFHGINRHEFAPDKGRAIGTSDIIRDLLLLKEHNIDAIRTSHYPNQSLFYRLCDRMGFYVIDEVNMETHGTGIDTYGHLTQDRLPGNHMEWEPLVLDRARNMAMRDKNHTSILLWSCGNESFDGPILMEESKCLRNLHDGRLIHYENVRFDSPYREISDIESQMYTKPQDVATFLNIHGDRPFILCEFCHAMGNSCGGLKAYTDLEDRYPAYQGGFIWDFRDQGLALIPKSRKVYSGTHGLYPTDEDFCCNGLFFADSDKSAKAEEVKKLYSPIRIIIEKDKVLIENRRSFTDTSDLRFIFSYRLDGKEIQSTCINRIILPRQETVVRLDKIPQVQEKGELVLCVKAQQARRRGWLSAGHIIVSSSLSLSDKAGNPCFVAIKDNEALPLIIGKDNVGAQANDIQFLVNKLHYGSLTAILTAQENILKLPISLEIWRAPTSNELANGSTIRWEKYKCASLYRKVIDFKIWKNHCMSIVDMASMKCSLDFSFASNGRAMIEIKILDRGEGFGSDMPCFGISFAMDKQYDHLCYYGNKTCEAYADRKESCELGYGEEIVEDQALPYMYPQETGNKTDIRYIEIVNKKGKGLRITCNSIFETSVLPWSCHEIEESRHLEDLPNHSYNVVRIMHGSCGIGGDDTWGAPVHPQYLYHGPKEPWKVCFQIIREK